MDQSGLTLQCFPFPLRPHKHYVGAVRSYQFEPVGAAPSWPAGAARGCPGTSAEPPEPRHDPGSPQTPRGGHRLLETHT